MKSKYFPLLFLFLLPLQSFAEDKVIIKDPRSVCLIVNRDSNDIGFMDLKTRRVIGNVSLGKWANPHMCAISPDGRWAVTGGTRSNRAYIIDVPHMKLVKIIPVDIGPEHLAFSPDSRYYYQGNPDGDSVSVIDMLSLKEIKRIKGFAMPLNITFIPDGTKAYVANYGSHWVGVIDVKRHELLKKIRIRQIPGVNKLDPKRYLHEIKGISSATLSKDGRYLYCADGDMGVVGVIDTREDKVVRVIRVGADPWRTYASADGKWQISVNNGDETISIIDAKANKVVATLEAGPDMVGVNYSHDKAFVISRETSFIYVYNLNTLTPAGRIRIGINLPLQTAATDSAGEKIYLASSWDHTIYIIDGKTEKIEKVTGVGYFPWGTYIMEGQDNYCH